MKLTYLSVMMCVVIAAASSQYSFPLKNSSNQRYFVDQNETPFLIVGDAPWDLPCALTLDNAMIYIRNADSLGFTFMEWRLLTKGFTRNAPNNAYNVAPFDGAMFQSAEVEEYWAHIDTLLDECAARNIVVWCFPAYLGYGGPGSSEGFYDEVNAASEAQMKAYGEYLGNRWQNRKNIVWGVGGDCDPTGVRSKLDSMMSGINEYCNHPRSPRNEPETWASDHWSGNETMSLTFNGFYSYSNTLYSWANRAYNWKPAMPFIEQETGYENEHSLTRQQVTAESWWSILGGATAGMVFGNCPIWHFDQANIACESKSWVVALQDPARRSMKQLSSILRERHWYNLVPDTSNTVADSGFGSGTTYCTTAFASDSSCVVSYMPTGHRLRIRLDHVKGDSVACRFVNASDGAVTDLGKKARVTTTFETPGSGDWVFVADGYTNASSVPPVPPVLSTPVNGSTGVMTNPTFTWYPSSGAAWYRLQVSTDAEFTTTVVDQGNLTATSFSVSSLAGNMQYYWRLNATNNAGTSDYSSPWTFTTSPPLPPPDCPALTDPANQATGVPSNPTLTWNASTGATSYRVQVSTDSSFATTVADQTNIVATSVSVTGLATSTMYFWRANATNSAGTSAYSPTWTFTTVAPPPPPNPPVPATPANGQTGLPTNLTLTWNASAGATSYHAQVSTNSAFTTPIVDQGGLTSPLLAVSGLTTNTTYYWHVSATNAGGTSSYSAASVFTTVAIPVGLVAAYACDEGTGTSVTDASGHGVTGTLAGATWTTGGKYGNGLSFNGTSSYVDLGNPTALQITGSMTWSAWVKASANPPDDGQIIAKSAATGGWQLKSSPDTGPHTFGIGVSASSSSLTQRYGKTTRSLNTWYHVAGVYDATGRALHIYVNGALDDGTLSGTVPASQYNPGLNVNIGRRSGGYYFSGIIDEVRIYSRALTQAEIQTDMSTPLGIPPQPPSAPVLAAPADGATGVSLNPTLTWNVATGATSYRVQVSTEPAFQTTVVDQSSLTSSSFAVSGLAMTTVYYWRVSASNNGGASAFAGPWRFTTVEPPPPPPTPLLAIPGNGATGVATNLTLKWNASTGATSYHVQLSADSAFITIAVDRTNIAADSLAVDGLTMSTTYYWHVSATGSGGTSDYSEAWHFTTVTPPPPPLAPMLTTPANGATEVATNPTLKWNTSSGATSYHVQLSTDSAFVTTAVDRTNIAADSLAVGGLTMNTTYYWHVSATGSGGTSTYSEVWHFTTVTPPPPPLAPLLMTPANGASEVPTSLTLKWNASSGATKYRVQVSSDSAFEAITVEQTDIAADSLAVGGLMMSTTYYWRVSATGNGGTSAYSAAWHFSTVMPPPPPLAPLLVTPRNGASEVPTSPTLKWNASSGATKYRVQVSGDSAFGTITVDQTDIAADSLSVGGLTMSTTYYWHVSATGSGGTSAYSEVWHFTTVTPPPPPLAPMLTTPANGASEVATNPTLKWNASSGATNYRVQVSGDSAFGTTTVDQTDIAADSLAVGGLTMSTTYYWRVSATGSGGTSTYSAPWHFTTVAPPPPPLAPLLMTPTNGATEVVTSPTLKWNASSGATSYHVQLSTDSAFMTVALDRTNIAADSLAVGGLTMSTTYYWRVSATGSGGTSTYSGVWHFTIVTPPPPPVAPVLATPANGATGVATNPTLTWNAPTGAASYRVQVSTSASFATMVVDQSGVTTTSLAISGLAANTEYFWHVNATNGEGTGAFSTTSSFTTVATPAGLVASYAFDEGTGTTVADASGHSLTGTVSGTTWSAAGKYGNALVFNGTSALVRVPNAASLQLTTGMTLEAWVNPAAVTNTWRDVIYKGDDNYYLEGTSAQGQTPAMGGTFSPNPLNAASALTANAWSHLAGTYDGATMRLYVNGVQAASRAQTGAIATSTNPLQVGGDGIYGQFFQGMIDEVRIYNRALTPAEIQTDMSTPLGIPPQPPSPPVLAAPADGATGVPTNPTLTWNTSTGATSYRVQVSTEPAFQTTLLDQSNLTSASYTLGELAMNRAYYWRVSATNNGGTSSFAGPWSFTTVEPPPPPAAPLLATPANGATEVAANATLRWNVSSGATSYHVQVSTDSTFGTMAVDRSNIATDSLALGGLTMTTTYFWRASASGSGGTSEYSTVWHFTTAVPPPPPLAPALATPARGANEVATNTTLSWTASGGATSYHVQVSADSLFATTIIDQADIASTTYAISGLAMNAIYFWHVSAANSGGTSGYSSAWDFRTAGLPQGLVAGYAFSEGSGTTVVDASGHGLTGTISGAAWTTNGRYGSALSFNGTSNYVNLGNPALLQITGSMTLSVWVKAAGNPTGEAQIISKSNGTYGWQLKTRLASGSHTFGTAVSADTRSRAQRYGTTVRSLNTWYHVAGVYNADSRTLDIYVNGVLDNGGVSGTIPALLCNSTFNVNIGRQSSGTYFNGTIDEVRIYNRALTRAEIQFDMNTPLGPPPPPAAPVLMSPIDGSTGVTPSPALTWNASTGAASYRVQVSQDSMFMTTVVDQSALTATSYAVAILAPITTYYWHVSATSTGGTSAYSSSWSFTTGPLQAGLVAAYAFDEGSGTTATDITGHGLKGTISGATWTAQGWDGNALSFNGSSSYVDLTNPTLLKITGSVTWSAWVKSAANPATDGQIIAKSSSTAGWQLKTSQGAGQQRFAVAVSPTSSSFTVRYSSTVRSLNTWYFVAGVYSAAARTLDIYVNGILDNGSLVGTVPASQYNSSVNVNIGRRSGGTYFNGTIDEVRLYNRALTQSEIQFDMNTPLGVSGLRPVRPGSGEGKHDSLLMNASNYATGNGIPTEYSLEQNYPNPFNPTTTLRFAIKQTAMTSLVVYDVLGREVTALVSDQLEAGYYTVQWNGTNDLGKSVASGVYFVRMSVQSDEGGTFSALRKVLLMK